MELNLKKEEVLSILKVIRSEKAAAKEYYDEHNEEDKREGVTSPEEWTSIYNSILNQAHKNDELTMIELMK
ncbi:hypothetical protein [Haloimpatiens lingqiaonensis]|uniref:hypothetical protein n=1 Tax=Haloimpatiens lingqiaonensis TaxID=1380675 RepID=UPI0010FDBEF9|nr:hypothetical protein [Haloimpatiens lingqiaonensis]